MFIVHIVISLVDDGDLIKAIVGNSERECYKNSSLQHKYLSHLCQYGQNE